MRPLQGQAEQQASVTIPDAGQDRSRELGGAALSSASYGSFRTPRSTASPPPVPWAGGFEIPRWMSRLGSYLNLGHQADPLLPSPLMGVQGVSPPGGYAFVLRSPPRPARSQREATPPSTSLPTEAIQLKVQRQLGGLIGRMQMMEEENDRLRGDLYRARLQMAGGEQGSGVQGDNAAVTLPPALPLAARGPSTTSVDGPGEPGQDLSGFQGGCGVLAGDHALSSGVPPPPPQSRPSTTVQGASGLWGDILSMPSGPAVHPTISPSLPQPPRPEVREPDEPPPRGEPQPGFFRSLFLGSRPRSPSPPQRPATSPPESPTIEALAKGIQQLQELQVKAMTKDPAIPSSEIVKPGLTWLAPLPDASKGSESALLFQDWLEIAGSSLADISERRVVEISGCTGGENVRSMAYLHPFGAACCYSNFERGASDGPVDAPQCTGDVATA